MSLIWASNDEPRTERPHPAIGLLMALAFGGAFWLGVLLAVRAIW